MVSADTSAVDISVFGTPMVDTLATSHGLDRVHLAASVLIAVADRTVVFPLSTALFSWSYTAG